MNGVAVGLFIAYHLNNRNKVNHLEMIGKVMALMDRFAKVFFGYEIWADVAPDKKFLFYGSLVTLPLTLLGIIDFFL